MRARLLAALIPALLGLGLDLLLASGQAPNPIVYARADLGTLSLLAGVGLSAAALGGWAVAGLHRRRIHQVQSRARAEGAADRRRFLQRLDHELKNPLTAIRAGLANLAHGRPDDSLASVEAQVERISRLTADLRKLAELETRPLERSPVNVAELLHQAVELAREQPGAADRRLALTLPQAPWPLPPISADPDLLLLAIHNLLDNAVKFSRPGDTIEVRAFEDGKVVVIEVADTGPGISAEDLPHVWEDLYRGPGARGVAGSGLGLALVQAIILRHRGRASLRSRAGQGTVFTVRLPVR